MRSDPPNDAHEETWRAWLNETAKAIPTFESDLAHDEQELARKTADYERLGAEIEEMRHTIEWRRRMVAVLTEAPVAGKPPEPPSKRLQPALTGGGPPDVPKTKPDIAARILEIADEGLFPREARGMAVQRGWLDNTPEAGNQLSVAMNKMAKQRRLIKDGDGRYYLPEWDDAPDPDASEELADSHIGGNDERNEPMPPREDVDETLDRDQSDRT